MYLYIKTHNKTGLKYLGKTNSKNPHKYKGSGKYWKRHIDKHGYDVTTTIIFESDNEEEIKQKGLFYSKLFDIIDNHMWANLKDECGDGGWDFVNSNDKIKKTKSMKYKGAGNPFYGKTHTETTKKQISEKTKMGMRKCSKRTVEHNEKIRNSLLGKKHSTQRKINISLAKKGKTAYNKGISDLVVECPFCNKKGGRSSMKRWHFNNCRSKT